MTTESQDLRALLLERDEEFSQLVAKHHELDARLSELSAKSHLSESEEVEETTLKKRKLHLKDKMEAILRRYRQAQASRSEQPSI